VLAAKEGTDHGLDLEVVNRVASAWAVMVFRDAAAYNPATRSWRRLPSLPEPRTGATVTWNGREVLVVGGQGRFSNEARPYGDGVAYNPASNRWRRLPAMDTGRIGHTAVWTGRQLLVWGGRPRNAGSWTAPAHRLAYDRASNRWSPLPRSPLRGRVGHIGVDRHPDARLGR
jgi:N-acetylneuraminic acid mutarotase